MDAEEKKKKLEKDQYYLERKMLTETWLKERTEYLKTKVNELIEYLRGEGIRTIGSVQLKDIHGISKDIDVVYRKVKETVDDIYNKKQEQAEIYANKLINETDIKERAMRIYEKPMLEEELKKRNETEIGDLKEYLISKHSSDVAMKHLLINSQKSKGIYLEGEMKLREDDLEERKEKREISSRENRGNQEINFR